MESNHIKITSYVKKSQIKVILTFKGPSIVAQSVTYDSFCQIGSFQGHPNGNKLIFQMQENRILAKLKG